VLWQLGEAGFQPKPPPPPPPAAGAAAPQPDEPKKP
jgi:hypothetical protein